ncbi:MAG: hypothetical protein K2Q01_05530 [Rickettsiales bacterium]|nr:hypothetical protein [Rickettsiales bacterium]
MVALPGNGEVQQVDTLDDPCAVEAEAISLRQSLSSASRDRTRMVLEQLKALNSRLPPRGRHNRRSAGVIISAISQAEQQLEAQEDDYYLHSHDSMATRRAFAAAVYTVMSAADKEFYNQIEQKATYSIAPVSDEGVVVTSVKEEVTGEELQQRFSILKYHSMSEAEKRDVLNRTFGTNNDSEVVATSKDVLKREREGLVELHQALKDMEAYKAYRHITGSLGYLMGAMGKIGRDHEVFERAHEDVDALIRAYDKLIENPEDENARTQLKLFRARMKRTLKDDVINKLLLEAEIPVRPVEVERPDHFRPLHTPLFAAMEAHRLENSS